MESSWRPQGVLWELKGVAIPPLRAENTCDQFAFTLGLAHHDYAYMAGRNAAENADAYQSFVTGHVFTALTKLEGHRGAYLLRRAEDNRVEFLAVTLWDTLDSIRAFAGDKIEAAVVEPEARAILSSYDDFVRHYDVAYRNICTGDKP